MKVIYGIRYYPTPEESSYLSITFYENREAAVESLNFNRDQGGLEGEIEEFHLVTSE